MLPDAWVEKALEIHSLARCFPQGTILKATLWLEEKHRESPEWKTAAVIALHYLVLAIDEESHAHTDIAAEYLCRAAGWREEVLCRQHEIKASQWGQSQLKVLEGKDGSGQHQTKEMGDRRL